MSGRGLLAAGVVIAGSLAPRPAAGQPPRMFVDAFAGLGRPVPASVRIVADVPAREERARFETTLDLGRTLTGEVGGAVRLAGPLALGAAFSAARSEAPGGIAIVIPHPIVFDRPATATAGTVEPLARQERTLHLQVIGVWSISPRVTVRAFGGPSRLRVTQDVVERIDYDESLAPGGAFTVAITGNATTRTEQTAWGGHAGGAVTAALGRHLGVTGLVRVTRASVDVPNTIQSAFDRTAVVERVRAGGLLLGAGVTLWY